MFEELEENELNEYDEEMTDAVDGDDPIEMIDDGGTDDDSTSNLPELHLACAKGNIDKVKALIEEKKATLTASQFKAYLEGKDEHGNTPLHIVCKKIADQYVYNNGSELFNLLITNGATVDTQNNHGQTPLHIACKYADEKLAKALIEYRVNINLQDNNGKTALHFACKNASDTDFIKFLVNHGANINLCDTEGNSVLHYACTTAQEFDVLKFLIANGAKINETNNDRNTALHIFLNGTHWEAKDYEKMILYFITNSHENTDLNIINNEGKTPLDLVLDNRSDDVPTITLLINNGALKAADVTTSAPLLNSDSDLTPDNINKKGLRGNTPLHNACKDGLFEKVKRLINHGADVNIINDDGTTVLHKAARSGHAKILEVLLNKSPNVDAINLQDIHGRTPLHEACGAPAVYDYGDGDGDGSYNCAAQLLKYSADPNVKDNKGNTPTHSACNNPFNAFRFAALLFYNGGDYTLKNNNIIPETPLDLVRKDTDKQKIEEQLIKFIELR